MVVRAMPGSRDNVRVRMVAIPIEKEIGTPSKRSEPKETARMSTLIRFTDTISF
jgi:hypothetical protein